MNQVISRNQASNAYQRLEFDQFDAAPPPPTEAEQPTGAEAVEPEGPLEIAPGVQLPTLEDLERFQEDARREGYAAGYEEGSARGRIEAAELHQMVEELDKAMSNFDQQVAEEIQALAIEIARQVVRDTLQTQPEAVLAVVREALLQLPQQSASIHVNPADADMLRRYLGEHYDNIHHRIAEDSSVAPGGCLIESAGAMIDAQIHTRWRRVVENLAKPAAKYLDE
ncbi:flagellar assembly protein FliH [Uliginosibacterium gangwonense]|uniref:flagellar assembly protein FliH n=1 Tax=Uliginosibacterium gangwonense TaxID=392736 RepID=UPI00036242DF|nr:flagellar assembly protein FliH [Uliginosibacterium gangwonense]